MSKSESVVFIVIVGRLSDFREEQEKRVIRAFEELFGENYQEVSRVIDDEKDIEIIYSIQTPVMEEDTVNREFYENLEILLEELRDYSPHFTQFRGVDLND